MQNLDRKPACKRCLVVLLILIAIPLLIAAYAWWRFSRDQPVVYADIVEHFKYGSTGGERNLGFPYWVWQALPQVCADYLPDKGKGYASLGMIYEEGKDLPVGVSKRRHMGIDRVFLNCAVCHSSTVRETPQGKSVVYTGMPANTFDLMGFQKFFFGCGADQKFRSEFIIPEIQRLGGDLDLLDRYLIYPVAIALMRERVLTLRGRFSYIEKQPEWGPGRVDTFSASKVLFNFPFDQLPAQELLGTADFPSIWLQRPRKQRDDGQPMQLHWDGNNTVSEERNKNAAFGTGATPPTIDLDAVGRLEDWLLDVKPPAYPYPIDRELATRGMPVYQLYCAGCHGESGADFKGARVGHVTPIAEIGTDRRRLDSFTADLAANLGSVYAGYDWRFKGFRKTFGYANLPLDGIWLRAPYLHNGSVPTLRDLLEPAANRPAAFYRGYDVYDQNKVGFVSGVAEEQGRRYFQYRTSDPGNGNHGHEGEAYGTQLPAEQKAAVIEYLKTF